MGGNDSHPIDRILGQLSDDDRAELERLVVNQDPKLWIEHQQRMFELKMWAVVVVVMLLVFIAAWLFSTFGGKTPDPFFLNIIQTVVTATLGSAGAQAAISFINKKRSESEAKQIEKK